MFADSLLESAPHPGHRTAWTKLVSTLLQATALAIALTIPLFHVERLHVIPPPPSIQIGAVQQAVTAQPRTTMSSAPTTFTRDVVRLTYTRYPISTRNDQAEAPPSPFSLPCTENCSAIGLNILASPGPFRIPPPPRREPSRPPRISETQLGEVVRKVVPEYPIIAKQIGLQGVVVLLATIGKDGRVEQVKPLSGPPLLLNAARQAVEQWQYRPYLLNHEPIEVQTQITVKFVLNRE